MGALGLISVTVAVILVAPAVGGYHYSDSGSHHHRGTAHFRTTPAPTTHHIKHYPNHQQHGAKSARISPLDRLLNRLDAEDADLITKRPEFTTERAPYLRSAKLADYEDDEELEDDEDEEEDSTEEEDDEEEAGGASQRPQADERGSRPPMSSYSERKWQLLGTPQGVDAVRARPSLMHRSSQPLEREVMAAVQNALLVKLIPVQSEHPHPAKAYIPHCALLHRCGDDTGCCRAETLRCVAKRTAQVTLYFYTTMLGSGSRSTTVEKLTFTNHTECGCEDRHESMVRDRPAEFRSGLGSGSLFRRPAAPACRCPSQFTARTQPDGSCTCDCFDKQRDCLRLKKGKEYFNHRDRLCVQSDLCKPPACEFGSYMSRAGRCPRKREKFAAWRRFAMHDEYN